MLRKYCYLKNSYYLCNRFLNDTRNMKNNPKAKRLRDTDSGIAVQKAKAHPPR